MEEKEKKLRDAASRGDNGGLRQLLAEGVEVNASTSNGWTALHHASWNGHTRAVKALLRAGATVDSRSSAKWTPLHRAANGGHTGTVKALLAAGADSNARDNQGWTALQHAIENRHTTTVKALLASGADSNAQNEKGYTALHHAIEYRSTTAVQALLTAGATVDAKTKLKEQTPLHFASRYGRTETVQALLTAGADINARDHKQWTPLHHAAGNGHPECVRVLLKAGANTTIKGSIDGNKKTAEEIARKKDPNVLKVFQLFKALQPKVVGDLLTIDLSGKGLTSVPDEVFDARDIERLALSTNRLTSIPEEIGQLQKLRELKLDNNLLTQLPEAIRTLPNLKHLDLSKNSINTLPGGFSPLTLHSLHLHNNRFKEFPRQVLQLEGLQKLYMGTWAGKGKPSPVPDDICRLKNLKVLDLQRSGLASLPDSVGELMQLRYLNISANKFTLVPDSLMNLSNLEKLDLSGNRISHLPLTLIRLAKLRGMGISGNPLTYPPLDVCRMGTAAIMDFLRRKLKEKEDGKELRKRLHCFSQNVTETREVEDLGVALQLKTDEMTSIIQGSSNQTPSYQAYNVLLKWMEKDREASMDKLQQELSDFGMDTLAEKVHKIKARPGKRPAQTSAGPPAKRSSAGESSCDGHQEEQLTQPLEENRTLRALVEEPQGKKSRSRRSGAKPIVLLLNDEYGTTKGGISTVHYQMTSLLAFKGAEVYSTVLSATEDDEKDAAADGVQLIFPTASERDKRKPCLDWLTFDHKARYPDLPPVDFIVGHVPITSHAARQIKEQRFPDAKLVQVTHVMPEDTNQYRSDERVLSIGDEQKNILEDLEHADVIISVGPYLRDYYKHETRDFKPHFEFLPKPSDIFSTAKCKYVDTGVKVVLSIGRVKGVERLKGYDLAAKSMGKVIVAHPNAKWRAHGISAEDFQESRDIIQANASNIHFTPLKYGTQDELRKDMEKANVVLMPSRAEPFGLIGLEAIAAGVPVLVSHKSGLAKFLKTQDHEFDRTIVEIEDDDDEAAKTLSKRIIKILSDGHREFQAAQSLKEKLLASEYWAASYTSFLETFGLEG